MPGLSLPPSKDERQQQRLQAEQDLNELRDHGAAPEEIEERDTGTIDGADAEEPREQEEAPRRLSSAEQRERDLEDMAARRREHLNRPEVDEEEDGGVQSGEVQTDAAPEPGEAQGKPAVQTSEQQDVAPGFYVDDKGQHRYRTVVNGEPVDVSADEAFQRLSQENQQLRQRQQAAPVQQQPTTSQQSPADNDVTVELADLRTKRKDALKRMYNGQEEAIDELDTIDSQIQDLTIKQAQNIDVIGQITQHQLQERQRAFQSRLESDEKELLADPKFKAVTGNPKAYEMATREAGRIMRESNAIANGVAPIDVMRQAVTNVMDIMGIARTVQNDTRQQRKQEIGNTAVSAGAAARQSQRLAQPEPTPDGGATPQQQRRSALAELRKLKGEKD